MNDDSDTPFSETVKDDICIKQKIGRRDLMRSVGGSVLFTGLTAGSSSARRLSVTQDHSAPEPDEYEDILRQMDGNGTEANPYIVTDVRELQAMDGDREAHYELGNNIDASSTGSWNPISDEGGIKREYLGSAPPDRDRYEVLNVPIKEDSEQLYFVSGHDEDPEPISSSDYTINYETGVIVFDEPPGTNRLNQEVRASYELVDRLFMGFDPISEFAGTFEGNGFEIQNIRISRPGYDRNGLFSQITGRVSNINIKSAEVSGSWWAGCLAGSGNDMVIKNVTVDGSVEGEKNAGGVFGRVSGRIEETSAEVSVFSQDSAGGLAGSIGYGSIRESFASGSVVGGHTVGGLVGVAFQHSNISQSFAATDVTGTDAVGGLIGQSDILVKKCYASGSVSGDSRVGGLVGSDNGGIDECYAVCEVDGNESIGGLSGDPAWHTDSYWDRNVAQIEAPDQDGALRTDQMTGMDAREEMEGFDFEETWTTVTTPPDYPELIPFGDPLLEISDAPTSLEVGADETFNVPVTVTNAGGNGTERISFRIDLRPPQRQDVSLGYNETQAVRFENISSTEFSTGEHEISIETQDDNHTATLQITEERQTSTRTATETQTATASSTETETRTVTATSTTQEETASPVPTEETSQSSDGDGPGFGVGTIIVGIGGFGYLLQRRLIPGKDGET